MPPPEQSASETIDAILVAAGWTVQDIKELNLSASRGVAVREIPLRLPSLDEQHQIVAEVEARSTFIDHLAGELETQMRHATKLNQSILRSAFIGDL